MLQGLGREMASCGQHSVAQLAAEELRSPARVGGPARSAGEGCSDGEGRCSAQGSL